jgi:hypothetical protein
LVHKCSFDCWICSLRKNCNSPIMLISNSCSYHFQTFLCHFHNSLEEPAKKQCSTPED